MIFNSNQLQYNNIYQIVLCARFYAKQTKFFMRESVKKVFKALKFIPYESLNSNVFLPYDLHAYNQHLHPLNPLILD